MKAGGRKLLMGRESNRHEQEMWTERGKTQIEEERESAQCV